MIKNVFIGLVLVTGYSGQAQTNDKILSAEKIITLIPDKIKEFYPSSDPKSKVIKLGNLKYAMAEKNFSANRKRSIKILLFDYKEAPIMYNQATRKFNTFTPVETDSVILRSLTISDCTGWESYNIHKKSSQILLGVCDRFFLTIEGHGVNLDFLKKVVEDFKLETFPK